MNVLLTCGGTAGHINPALAVARRLKNDDPNTGILFVGAEGGMETRLVPREGWDLKTVPISSFRRSFSREGIAHNRKTLRELRTALRLAGQIINEFRPDVILGTGGYASFPALRQGQKKKIPTLVHEANAVPGLTTKMVSRRADRVLVNYEECAGAYRHPERVIVTGMPVKEEFFSLSHEQTRRGLGLDETPFVLSAFGSLGARDMNHRMTEFIRLESDLEPFVHVHAAGSSGWEWLPEEIASAGVRLELHPSIRVLEYLYNMPELMTAADLMICRAGASTLSELTAAGLPAIIVPSPNVTNNHQEKNARLLEKRGGAIVLTEAECSGSGLFDLCVELLSDPKRLAAMSEAQRAAAVPDALERICALVRELGGADGPSAA